MKQAARAIIIVNDRILTMHRDKYGSKYYTLPGGQVAEDETTEQTLIREIKEETNLDITNSQLVFIERHPKPYNQQFIYLCEISPSEAAVIQNGSEEEIMNRYQMNIHKLIWVDTAAFKGIAFRTPQLQSAIVKSLEEGFPDTPEEL